MRTRSSSGRPVLTSPSSRWVPLFDANRSPGTGVTETPDWSAAAGAATAKPSAAARNSAALTMREPGLRALRKLPSCMIGAMDRRLTLDDAELARLHQVALGLLDPAALPAAEVYLDSEGN